MVLLGGSSSTGRERFRSADVDGAGREGLVALAHGDRVAPGGRDLALCAEHDWLRDRGHARHANLVDLLVSVGQLDREPAQARMTDLEVADRPVLVLGSARGGELVL